MSLVRSPRFLVLRHSRYLGLAFALFLLAPGFGAVKVTPHPEKAGKMIPPDFLGLSIETQSILPDNKGALRYRPDNQALLSLFKTIGIKSLRVGGNTVDDPKYPVADNATVDGLFQFAKAAGLKVIFSYRLKGVTDFSAAAAQAKYIHGNYPDQLDAIEIGNEPDLYSKSATFETYLPAWKTAASLIHVFDGDIRFAGPATAGSSGQWAKRMADELRGGPLPIAFVCQHYYFGGSARAVKDPAATRDMLLSDKMFDKYKAQFDKWVPDVLGDGVAYRLDETNSCYSGGAADVSDTMASALWALMYMHWWAEHDCGGVNLHSGDKNGSGLSYKFSSNYALFWQSDHGYEAKPIAYGAKAFAAGSAGKRTPVEVDDARLRAYAVTGEDAQLCLTLINPTGDAMDAAIPAGSAKVAALCPLVSPNHDSGEKTGITFAGGAIAEDGTFKGKPTDLKPEAGNFNVSLPPMSAAVIQFRER